MKKQNRRDFLKTAAISTTMLLADGCLQPAQKASAKKPNIVFVFGDQWRAQATGYSGDPNLKGKTPNLDKLAAQSVNLTNAVSTCPVCTPYRASMLTGQYALTHGLFLNDAPLRNEAVTIAEVCKNAGYDTAYVGKWHINAGGRNNFIPENRRQGFDYWKVLECTHNYNNSLYYTGNDPTKRKWPGYDAIAQTRDVQEYIKAHADNEKPFLIMLSWGPPHNPYGTAPEKYRKMFMENNIILRPNVPPENANAAKKDLAGYYAHIVALDDCIGNIVDTIDHAGIKNNTIVVFTSDHGDMLGSHGYQRKQKPWDESVRVPFLIRYPAKLGKKGKTLDMPFETPDIMPTLLSLCDLNIPNGVEGVDYSRILAGKLNAPDNAALIECASPFGEWLRKNGGKEYRGIRTKRFTYVRDLNGPWLLYDNQNDPYQKNNLVNSPQTASLQKILDTKLMAKLKKHGDEFKQGSEYIKKWGYKVDAHGTLPY
ncbi:MAG: sulfatase [Sedimentisphaerales bacterium]|nr:sulfatase [Sedimentisphaerales bacterium]